MAQTPGYSDNRFALVEQLRQIMALDHLIAELERIGDLAVNIAEEALSVIQWPRRKFHRDLPRMARMVLEMIKQSLSAYANYDANLAREVCRADDEVDALDRDIIQELLQGMAEGRKDVTFGQSQINVVRNLERAGDHATNIAQQVVYMVEGESVRHRCQGWLKGRKGKKAKGRKGLEKINS